VQDVDPRHAGKQRGGEMREARHSRRAVVERAGLGLRERDELCEIVRGQARENHQHIRLAADHADGREILDRVVGEGAAERRRNRLRARRGDADSGAVGRRLRHRLDADIAAGAGAVFDHDLCAEGRRELLRDDARNDVGAAAGRERHDQADRSLRPRAVCGLRGGGGRKRGARNQERDKADHAVLGSAADAVIPPPARGRSTAERSDAVGWGSSES